MSIEIADVADGILTVQITGTLAQPELATVQSKVADIIQKQGKVRILVVADNFRGWARGGDWGDLSFGMENDASIQKMAIVGEKKWEDLAVTFAAKGLRPFPIEYFQPADLARARAWLTTE